MLEAAIVLVLKGWTLADSEAALCGDGATEQRQRRRACGISAAADPKLSAPGATAKRQRRSARGLSAGNSKRPPPPPPSPPPPPPPPPPFAAEIESGAERKRKEAACERFKGWTLAD